MLDLDMLLNQAIAEGEIVAGFPLQFVVARNPGAAVSLDLTVSRRSKYTSWNKAEEEFVRRHAGYYTDEEIAVVLGRSEQAVKLYRQRHLGIRGASRHPDFLTAHQIATMIGVDGHSVIKLFDRGLLPGWKLGDRIFRITRRITFFRWAVNPLNWCYFIRSVRDTTRITDEHLRRLIERQKERWNDEWWSTGEVAEYYGVHHTDVNRYIHQGKFKAVKWGNNWILRSEATRPGIKFYKGKEAYREVQIADRWSEAADSFILRSFGEGRTYAEIAAMMKLKHSTVRHRVSRLVC